MTLRSLGSHPVRKEPARVGTLKYGGLDSVTWEENVTLDHTSRVPNFGDSVR